jgi:hypothetical protein
MATLPTQVRPGDVISSELMNAILEALSQLQGGIGGTQIVPNLFGATLLNARGSILQPGRQLQLGLVVDVSGASIDPMATVNNALVVLNQNPTAEARVVAGTPVNLLVSRVSNGSQNPPVNPPTIARTETAGGSVSTSFAVGATVAIVGTGFSATASQNAVTFNDRPAASVANDPADPTRRLLVVVPTQIQGAPVNPGDAALNGVVLRVSTTGAGQVQTTLTVTAPVPSQPTITQIAPLIQDEGANITITGTNFTSNTQVRIRNVAATVVGTPTATTLVATVPQFADIQPGTPVPAAVVVSVPASPSPLEVNFSGTFRVRGI